MHADLILVCHAATAALRSATFPSDDPLDEQGMAAAATVHLGPPHDRAWCAPSLACRQTASALGLEATVERAIRDCDFGRWAGHSLGDVARDEPEAFHAWMTDPDANPHGGETFSELLQRVAVWVDECRHRSGRTIVVTHSAVIRAAIVVAVEAATATFWHVDVGPLSQTWLRTDGRRWALRGLRS